MTSTFKIDDPALRVIDEHRLAAKIFVEAVECEANASISQMLEATEAPRNAMFAAGAALVTTWPTTIAGAIAMSKYLATVFDETGIESSIMPPAIDTSDDEEEAWQAVAFRTLASALAQMQPATAAEAQ
jgi:hypothetical protein